MNSKSRIIAKHEPVHCLCPGLFSSVKKGERKKLDIRYQHGTTTIEFRGADQLGVDDLRVLQGLISLAGRVATGQSVVTRTPKTETGAMLRKNLEIKGEAINQDAIAVRCSWKNLADEIGFAWGGSRMKALRRCVERMYIITIFVETEDRKRSSYRLLSSYSSDQSSLCIVLNPAIATAITGGRYVKIDMNEVKALKSDPARLIHQRLCAYIDPSNAKNINFDTLSGYVYGEGAVNENLAKFRRKMITKALGELKLIGWHVMEANAGTFRVRRS